MNVLLPLHIICCFFPTRSCNFVDFAATCATAAANLVLTEVFKQISKSWSHISVRIRIRSVKAPSHGSDMRPAAQYDKALRSLKHGFVVLRSSGLLQARGESAASTGRFQRSRGSRGMGRRLCLITRVNEAHACGGKGWQSKD